MYIPKHFLMEDRQNAIAFMQTYSFGTIVSAVNNLPIANHLPFLIHQENNQLTISSHFAKANPQAAIIEHGDVLVIFSEPHAYISPKHYEKETNVPTWNYMAIHAYGKARVMEGEQEHLELLERTINRYEPGYLKQWISLPPEYKSNMIKGITGFEITVADLQAKSKLSQNRTENEKLNIINSLSSSKNSQEKDIANYMTVKKDT